MAQTGIKVKNIRQFHRALKNCNEGMARGLDDKLREAGDIVATEAQQRFSTIDTRSAAGFRSRVKGFGRVVVEQQRRRKSGLRGDYGVLQMQRALLPARAANEERIIESVEDMLDTVGRREGF